jgi:hypothetical protein
MDSVTLNSPKAEKPCDFAWNIVEAKIIRKNRIPYSPSLMPRQVLVEQGRWSQGNTAPNHGAFQITCLLLSNRIRLAADV